MTCALARTLAVAVLLAIAPLAGGAQTELVLRVATAPVDQATPIFYGLKSGLYKRSGLNVELVKLPNSAAIVSALLGGSIDVGQGSPLAPIVAVSKGIPLTVIGNLTTYSVTNPTVGLLVATASPLKTAKDLEGKTLGVVGLQDMSSLATFGWLEKYGVDRSTLRFVELPASATLAALEGNRIDASTVYEPFLTSFLASGKVRVLGYPYDSLGARYATGVIFSRSTWADEHRDAVARFLRATQEAALYVGAHENESAALIAEYTGVDPASLAGIRHGGRGVPIANGDLQPMIDAAFRFKQIPQAFPAAQIICSCALRRADGR